MVVRPPGRLVGQRLRGPAARLISQRCAGIMLREAPHLLRAVTRKERMSTTRSATSEDAIREYLQVYGEPDKRCEIREMGSRDRVVDAEASRR